MLRSRFLWKLYAAYAALILFTAGIVGWLVTSSIQRDAQTRTDDRLRTEVALLRAIAQHELGGTDTARLQARIAALGREVGTRLTVIRADGVVVADSEQDPARMDDHGDRPEVIAAQAHGEGVATRFSSTLGRRMRYLALPVVRDGALEGYARASLPLAFIHQRLAHLRQLVLLGAAIATLLALALGFFIARRVTHPLRAMTAAAEALASGDYTRQLTAIDRSDELGMLATAFNTMRHRLRDQLDTISRDHHGLTAILGSMVEGVVAVDREEKIVHLNRVAGELFGTTPEEACGRHLWEVTRIRGISEALAETLERGEPTSRELHLPGRTDRVLALRASPLQDEGPGPGGAVLVLDDVTALRRLETMRSDFVANVSHELKTPVTVIRGLVETILDDRDMETTTRRRFLDKVHNQAGRLSSLVTDLLSLSRLESRDRPPETGLLDLRESINEAVQALQPAGEAKEVEIAPTLPIQPVWIEGDAEALVEAVSNLLDNAVKYSPAGGCVEVELGTVDDTATITVRDHGPGIAPHHRERIFERFYRVDKARSRALGGTGLGLAIVKHVALSHDGRVDLTSTVGRGSTFRIHLPVQAAPPHEEAAQQEALPFD